MARYAQYRVTLAVRIEAGGVYEDLSLDRVGAYGFKLQVEVYPAPLPRIYLLDLFAYVVEREPRIGIESEPRQGGHFVVGTVADDRKFVVYRLISGSLHPLSQIVVYEGGLSRRKGAQHRNQRPPRNVRRICVFRVQKAVGMRDLVEGLVLLDDIEKNRVLFRKVLLQFLVSLLGRHMLLRLLCFHIILF